MSDLKIFSVTDDAAVELPSTGVSLERELQILLEKNLENIFGVRYLASEYSTGKVHRGRIDSLGLDETGSPVILEYKRSTNENVINQGLFYLDWLLDHQAEFRLLVEERLGRDIALKIDWSAPRLICVAGDFTRYDEYAVRQIDRNVELVRYRVYGTGLLAIELVTSTATSTSTAPPKSPSINEVVPKVVSKRTRVSDLLERSDEELTSLYEDFDAFAMTLGDDVVKNERQDYFAYRRLKNFACVEVHPNSKNLLVYLKLDPQTIEPVDGLIRDVSNIGHFGTGDVEVRIKDRSSWDLLEELTRRAYEEN
ncbi:DUF5655 domain-containing protein [Glutamicibacter sp. AGC46]